MEVWTELTSCMNKIQDLRSIVQNEVPTSYEDFAQWSLIRQELTDQLSSVQSKISEQFLQESNK
jgi:chloramphenicol O-acetyltransferase